MLGIQFQDDQKWSSQISGKGGLLSALNSRLYFIKRLKNHLAYPAVIKLVDGLFTSKLRYGLQLLGKVRTSPEDMLSWEMKAIQLVQNKLLRTLNGSKIKEKISVAHMLAKFKMLSVSWIWTVLF